MSTSETIASVTIELTKRLTDDGKLIEAGFAGYRLVVLPENAPPIQVDECRLAFMAGAEHLFSSVMSILDPGSEPTDDDLRRMSLIAAELDDWKRRLTERVNQKRT